MDGGGGVGVGCDSGRVEMVVFGGGVWCVGEKGWYIWIF